VCLWLNSKHLNSIDMDAASKSAGGVGPETRLYKRMVYISVGSVLEKSPLLWDLENTARSGVDTW